MASSDLPEAGRPGLLCPGCKGRLALSWMHLTADTLVCTECGLQLAVARSAIERTAAAWREFERSLRQIGSAIRVKRALAALEGALHRMASAFRSGRRQEPIVLGLQVPARHASPPAEPGRPAITARLGRIDCALRVSTEEPEGFRRLRELLDMRN